VAIINRAFARRYFGEQDPVGRTLDLGEPPQLVRLQIGGVVADTVQTSLMTAPPAILYLPFAQRPFFITSFVIRTGVDQRALASAVRREAFAAAPDVPVLGFESLDALLARSFAASSHRALLLGLLSGLAVVLAIVGIHGIASYNVATRIREIGVRRALGAQRRLVLQLIVRQGLRPALLGIVLGLALSLTISRLLTTVLFRVSAMEPRVLLGTAMLLLLVSAAACLLPARRAMQIDPLVALSSE
jgi:putative ABC transport system permease protein